MLFHWKVTFFHRKADKELFSNNPNIIVAYFAIYALILLISLIQWILILQVYKNR